MMPRLVLFDIDGTLLSAQGEGRLSLEAAFQERFGRRSWFDGIRFHGSTDPDIVAEGLSRAGGADAEADALIERYLAVLEGRLRERPPRVLPGALQCLEALRGVAGLVTGLVTGNVRRGAEIKLGAGGIADGFRVGAFGGEATTRGGLVRLARERAELLLGGRLEDGRVFYVGDTVQDVIAARDGAAVAVAVATGGEEPEDLRAAAPDHLLDGLEPASRLLEVVLA